MDVTPAAKKRIAALIEEREMALLPLAARVGVSQSTLWNFVYGHTRNFSKLHRLATELKVSLEWIMHGDASSSSGAARGVARLAEPQGADFKQAVSDGEKILIREITGAAVAAGRAHPKLGEHIIGGIALALWADFQSGKIPMPRAPGKATAKAIEAEMQRLVAYELGKLN